MFGRPKNTLAFRDCSKMQVIKREWWPKRAKPLMEFSRSDRSSSTIDIRHYNRFTPWILLLFLECFFFHFFFLCRFLPWRPTRRSCPWLVTSISTCWITCCFWPCWLCPSLWEFTLDVLEINRKRRWIFCSEERKWERYQYRSLSSSGNHGNHQLLKKWNFFQQINLNDVSFF